MSTFMFEPGAVYEIYERKDTFTWIHLYGYRRIRYSTYSSTIVRSYDATVLCDGKIQDWLFFEKNLLATKKIS